jgi:hypothetical protein
MIAEQISTKITPEQLKIQIRMLLEAVAPTKREATAGLLPFSHVLDSILMKVIR